MPRFMKLKLLLVVLTSIAGQMPVTAHCAEADVKAARSEKASQLVASRTAANTSSKKDVTAASKPPQIETRFGEVYVKRESGSLKADVYMPAGEGPFPGVVVIHGGAWFMGTRAQLGGAAKLLAQNGMTAVAISYRLAPKNKFPAQIDDCKAAVRWMRAEAKNLKIDPDRIGGFGYSAGAQLVTLLGTTDADDGLEGIEKPADAPSTRLQAVVAGGVPCDFRIMDLDSKRLAFWLGGTRRQVGDLYRLASPRAFVTEDDPPMFFFHGEKDDLVPMISPEAMVQSLTEVDVPSELYVVPLIGHNLAALDRTALNKSVAFLGKVLGKKVLGKDVIGKEGKTN